jgi:hypothetical protein
MSFEVVASRLVVGGHLDGLLKPFGAKVEA